MKLTDLTTKQLEELRGYVFRLNWCRNKKAEDIFFDCQRELDKRE